MADQPEPILRIAPSPLARPQRSVAHDRLFAEAREASDFDFGRDTAAVFDDMLVRSVPFYTEMQRMIAEIAEDYAQDGTNVYDLGCSTCATFRALRGIERDVTFVGIDSSADMIARAEQELRDEKFDRRVVLKVQDLHHDLEIENASVVVMNLTLQFVRPLHRERVMQKIFDGMNHQSCLILIEKVLTEDSTTNRLFIKHYYDFKRRNGYSETEISQKREALENVLVPYRVEENRQLLTNAGFRWVEPFFRWYNFCGILALK